MSVHKFKPVVVGDNYRFDPDEILDGAKGEPFDRLLVIGEYDDGELYIAGNCNSGETLVLMERSKLKLIGV